MDILFLIVPIVLIALIFPMLAVISYKVNVLAALRNSYIFWAAISLLNFNFLGWLAIPPILIFLHRPPSNFLPFILPPLALTIAVGVAVVVLLKFRWPKVLTSFFVTSWGIYLVNALFLLTFVTAADIYKNHLISKSLEGHKPECIVVRSFLSSMLNAGEEFQFKAHAFFKEDERNYYWSYSKQNFFPGNERLDNNFQCQQK